MTFTMTQEERETFLAALHVGVLGISAPDRAPVLVPVWYSYEPGGEIVFITNKNAKKAKRLEQEGRFTLCVQDESPPYKYVSVEGPIVSIEDADHERELTPIAHRYLGKERGDAYVTKTSGDEELLVRMRPARWSTADYGKNSA
ncbi:MAG: TIGR03618 family F420-dependent PPOX class oxidoreductase [Anaerolineales bacterium]|jgi:PPOX class probable F420-dependent enzyme|nr:TIGR03618 family F420-dependent PPOX class oxidoreductase [Anaerolineales bacterium]